MWLTHEEVQQFHDQSFVVAGPVLSPARVEALREAFDGLSSRWSDELGVSLERYLGAVSQWTNIWREHPAFEAHLHEPRMLDAARQLLGVDDLRLFHDHLIIKQPNGASGAVPWHQDYPFWPVDKPVALSCWVALDDVRRDSGGMRFLPGAHKDGEQEPVDFLAKPKDWGPREVEQVVVEVPAGWGVFHSCLSWHWSPPNQSAAPRRAIIAIILDADLRYAPHHGGWHPMNEHVKVAAGERLNDDAFPLLGKETAP
jgi:ectoine hydroxylase-related dioxygenase (phytanoyl-CoA dioxygenase family)